jgi:3-deoxy-manno-octulosonate cytidylyltransferase (CMP-KDO synthetase)
MLQHVFERASMARYLTSTIIATDDQRVYDAARSFGAPVRMTRSDHVSGTDRVAEVASAETASIIVNIQGDEPLIDPDAIDAAILPLVHNPDVVMATLKKRIEDPHEAADPNVVKVVTNHAGDAIYFSRSPIPHFREPASGAVLYKHIGLYVYRREFLLNYSSLPVGPLEQAERLEQLRALENGHAIRVVETDFESIGVDTPEDLARVARLFELGAGPRAMRHSLTGRSLVPARKAPEAGVEMAGELRSPCGLPTRAQAASLRHSGCKGASARRVFIGAGLAVGPEARHG